MVLKLKSRRILCQLIFTCPLMHQVAFLPHDAT